MGYITDSQATSGAALDQETLPYLPMTFEAVTAVTAKRVVAINTGGKVAIQATNGTATLGVGIALKAIAAGDQGEVITFGYAANVPATGAVAAGDILKRSVTTAGSVAASATPVLGEAIGVAINASASNLVNVWVGRTALT